MPTRIAHGTATGAMSMGMSTRGVGVSPGVCSDAYWAAGERVCISLGRGVCNGHYGAPGNTPLTWMTPCLCAVAPIETSNADACRDNV